jgi:hypothetical protein
MNFVTGKPAGKHQIIFQNLYKNKKSCKLWIPQCIAPVYFCYKEIPAAPCAEQRD